MAKNIFPSKKRPTKDLIPYANNARLHSKHQIEQIAASITEYGFTNPVVIDEADNIIAGHGRVLAAQSLGMESVPCVVVSGWTDAQKKAYVIADNKLALNATWDEDLLMLEMIELKKLDFNLDLTGFNTDELTNLFLEKQNGETDPNAEWEGMPEFQQDDAESFRRVIVHFENNEAVADFFKLIKQSHTDKTRSIWHPEKPNDVTIGIGYETE